MRLPFRPLSLLAATLVATGCTQGEFELRGVRGKVTLDGQPLENAKVEFFPVEDGSSALAWTQEDGTFELEFAGDLMGAPAGKYTVSVSKVEDSPEGDRELLLPIYNDETTLSADVSAEGENSFTFELKSTAG